MTYLPLLHEYLPDYAEALIKVAFTADQRQEFRRKAGVVGSGLAGMGLGTLAGVGVGKLLEHSMGKPPAKSIMYAGPLLGAASALAYNLYKKKERAK